MKTGETGIKGQFSNHCKGTHPGKRQSGKNREGRCEGLQENISFHCEDVTRFGSGRSPDPLWRNRSEWWTVTEQSMN